MADQIPPCVYCGSKSYGKNCMIAPHKVHMHMGDASKCVWCGSRSIGKNCPYNPFGPEHIRGIEYNQMVKESVGQGIIGGYIISKLKEPTAHTEAFKLGLVDESGKVLRKPVTLEENKALGVVERYVLNLKSVLGMKIDMATALSDIQLEESVSLADYEKICDEQIHLRADIKTIVSEFQERLTRAYADGLSSAMIEKVILEAFEK